MADYSVGPGFKKTRFKKTGGQISAPLAKSEWPILFGFAHHAARQASLPTPSETRKPPIARDRTNYKTNKTGGLLGAHIPGCP